jgi:DnaB-like helicase C terminal domain
MTINYFESLEKEIQKGLNEDLIDMGFKRLNNYIGLRKSTNYLIGGMTGSGKTSATDSIFVLNPYEWINSKYNTSNLKLKIFYFSMERRKNVKLAKWISCKIFQDKEIIISPDKILGWTSKNYKLTLDEHDLVLEQKDYINCLLNETVTLIENPQNPMGIKKVIDAYATANGTFEEVDQFNKVYIPNNSKEVVLVVKDHLGLLKKETRKYKNGDVVRLSSKKEIIDAASEDDRKFRDVYGYSVIQVSQFNRSLSNPTRIKMGQDPLLDDFKDTGNVTEDADVVLSLFDPWRYNIEDPSGYDLQRLRTQNGSKMYRNLKILKNTYGAEDVRIGLAFQPVIGMCKEMPRIDEITDQDYDSILNSSYFNKYVPKRTAPF